MPRLSSGVVVVAGTPPHLRYLLLRAYKYWDFPKGAVEWSEEPLAAACREVREETGLSALTFRWGTNFIETEPYAGGKVARYYVAHSATTDVTLGVNPLLRRPEHHEYRWLSYTDAASLLNERVRRVLEWARERVGGGD